MTKKTMCALAAVDTLSPALARRAARLAWLFGAAVLAAACATTGTAPAPTGQAPVSPGTAPAPEAPPSRPAPATPTPLSPLATEQRFLEDWFRGTPVVIAVQGTQNLNIEVPLTFSFDAGKADIKPALAAVLERVAESLRRQAGARVTVAAPADNGGAAALAQQRAQRVREYLVARRVAAPRVALAEGSPRSGGPIQLRLVIPPAAFPDALKSAPQPVAARGHGLKAVSATSVEAATKKP
jgi:outer membrane protein OmpA-like peptidoglycan-associated protein